MGIKSVFNINMEPLSKLHKKKWRAIAEEPSLSNSMAWCLRARAGCCLDAEQLLNTLPEVGPFDRADAGA